MFYWMKRSSGGSDTLDRLGNMSKAEILRGIVTEKLSTAAQEILAVVERTVAGYEEEASGFRREIERQKRQLELLLQPRVKLERRDLNPDGEDHEVVVLREEKEEEEQHTQRSAVEDTGSLGLLWFGEEEDGDGDDGVDEEQQLSAASSRQRREDLKDPDYQITSRVISPRARSDRRKPGRPRLSDTQSHLDLRICILEDSQTDVLSNTVFRKYPVQQFRCPRGLQEADFLDLLRSTFPQLADQKPFDVFTSDWSKRLQPLRAKTLTPEEICRSIRLTGSGNSALYIRLKTGEDPQSSSDNLHPLQRTDDPPSVSATTSADETDTRTRFFQVIPPQSEKRKPGRPRLSDIQSHLDLRICILEDSQTDVLSNTVFRKYPVQQVRCPRGLQEADFLDLLRSTFPQLADQKPFDVFTSDRSRRLQPLRAKTLTPEEICWSIRLMGSRRTANSALYIRLKTAEDPQSSSDNLHPLQRTDDPPSVSATTSADETDTRTRLSSPRVQSERRKRGRPRIGEEPTHHLLRVCMLEDSQSDLLSNKVLMKSSVQEVRCPRGLQEADFLDLLRSAIPQLEGDDKQFDVFKSDSSRRLHRVKVKTMTPEEIFRNTKSSCADKTLLYIRLKTGEEEEEEEELRLVQRNDEVTSDSPSSAAVLIRSDGADLSASPVQHVEGNGADVLSSSSASQQQKVGTKEADDGDAAESQVESSDDDKDGDEALDKDDDWKPDPELGTPKMRRKRGARASGVEGRLIGSDKIPCKVCGVWYRILGSLIKHAWSHLDEAQSICGVCGERFESTEELKGHLKKYQKTHECSYCRKSFSTITGLKCHTTLHTGNRPFKCDVCNKSFPRMSGLSIHRWVHVEDKPHKCHICPKAFGLKAQLRAHIKVHTGRDKYHCNLCSKSFYDLRSLTSHKATHSGERRYSCGVCGKSFKLPGTLKSHEKTHTERERPYLCHICCKTFISNCSLTAHMKTHSSERPFICIICSKGFISNGRLKGHMLMHTGEAPYGCSECGRFFKHKSHLNNHVRSHLGIKLFVCTVCGKACSRQEHLTVHMRTHNGERPYQCSVCDKAFTQSHCLKTHMKSHQGEENPFVNASSS